MRRLIPLFTPLALLLLASPGGVHAQEARMDVAVDAVSVRGEGNPRLTQVDLYTQIPYTELHFSPGPRGFVARYRVAAEVQALDNMGRPTAIIQSPIWERSVTVPIHAQTVSRTQKDLTTHKLFLEPGPYLINFEITDLNTQETQFRERIVNVRDLDRPFAISDLVLIDRYDPETLAMTPRVGAVLGESDLDFEIYFELYTAEPQEVTVTTALFPRGRMTPVFTDTVRVAASSGRRQMVSSFPATDLQVGRYRVRVQAQAGDMTSASELVVISQWTGLSAYLEDLDLAIDQMIYVASPRDLRRIRRADTETDKRRLFNEFWRVLDEIPETDRNERMEQYYFRVNLASRLYKAGRRDGWRTDRGHVYILHGEPDDTRWQNYSFNTMPYEVWYYYRIGRMYVFVDRTGFGDYELTVPIWDERTRIR